MVFFFFQPFDGNPVSFNLVFFLVDACIPTLHKLPNLQLNRNPFLLFLHKLFFQFYVF